MPKGERYNQDKPKISMVLDARRAIYGAARVLMHGEEKYSRGNWLNGLPWTEIIDSLERHLLEFNAGNDIDDGPKGSGLPHVHHILANALFLAEMVEAHPELDDRSFKENGKPRLKLKWPEPLPDTRIGTPLKYVSDIDSLHYHQWVWAQDPADKNIYGPYTFEHVHPNGDIVFVDANDKQFKLPLGSKLLEE